MKSRYSPPPQRPRRLPPLIVEDPFRYRRPLELDFSSDVNLESGTNYSGVPLFTSTDQGLTSLPDCEDYDDEVKERRFIYVFYCEVFITALICHAEYSTCTHL